MIPNRNFIDGQWLLGSGGTFTTHNPATGAALGEWPESTEQDVDDAVVAAARAQDGWRRTPVAKRGEILLRSMAILASRKDEHATMLTREMGKVLAEARGDVQEAIDTALYYAGEGRRFFGQTTTSELPRKFAMSIRQPVGVCAMLTPWNFPMAIPSWKTYPALLCGNSVVLKPSNQTPATATAFVQALAEAGVPHGVVNLVHGGGVGAAGEWLLEHPRVSLVSFTGSSAVGRHVAQACGRALKRCSLELGGKNAQIVMDDADLDLALDGALWGAFGTSGQRCTATSRLIVHERVYDDFTERLCARAEKLVIGNGLDPRVEVGPMASRAQLERTQEYVSIGRAEGAALRTGGEPLRGGAYANGFFHQPTVFEATPRMRIAREEIFGPVTTLLKVRSFEEAIALLNDTSYGLSGAIYTRDIERVMSAIEDMQVGIAYVNAPTIGAEVHLPFGGLKDTGNGRREAGQAALDAFSEWKAVYIDYSGRLQKAQISEPNGERI